MKNDSYGSWGRNPPAIQQVRQLNWRDEKLPVYKRDECSYLPRGNGRSYGDVCLNDGGLLLACRQLDRFISFDKETGVLSCESGVLLSDILQLTVANGWFIPVTPGTQFVTVGGAIANDVHGKNHHSAGTFGRHVLRFELVRSDGSVLICSPTENQDFFRATIGGLGLTGVITWAEIQLHAVQNAFIDQEVIRFRDLEEFFDLARESDQDFEHTVAWIDCLARGKALGRGLFTRGNYAKRGSGKGPEWKPRSLAAPFDFPFSLVNSWSIKAFNSLYLLKHWRRREAKQVHYQPFFYPLDAIKNWNRIYGRKGFYQYQCVIPTDTMVDATREILERISQSRTGSFLAVLKLFGELKSPGLLSFPMQGATLALDFPNQGDKTLTMLSELDEVTRSAGGRINPSKDARMSAIDFQAHYPDWTKLEAIRDPSISSGFWRRVTTNS